MFDAGHRFVLSYEWSLPWWKQGHTWYQHVLGNWQLNGITTYMSGTPFTVFDSHDFSLEGTAPEITGFSSNRPNLVGDPNSGLRTVQEWFNINAFQRLNPVTQAGQFGTAGRNIVQGPGYQDWDFSACKNIPVAEESNFSSGRSSSTYSITPISVSRTAISAPPPSGKSRKLYRPVWYSWL